MEIYFIKPDTLVLKTSLNDHKQPTSPVPSTAVFMVTNIFSTESSTGMVYRLSVDPLVLLPSLRLLFDPPVTKT